MNGILKHFIYSFAMLFFLVTNNLQAQVKITPYLGTTISNLKNTEIKNYPFRHYNGKYQSRKMSTGIIVSMPLNDFFELGLDLNLRRGKANRHDDAELWIDYGFAWIDYTLIYFQPNVKFNYKSFVLQSGISYGHILKSNILGIRKLYDAKNLVDVNFGVHFGLGYQIKNVLIMFEHTKAVSEFIVDDRLDWVQLKVGYQFVPNKDKS